LLGDRACLSLALITSATAVTADRAWLDLTIGVNIALIR
jgi:PIN domain nuclease of toxin-antitoxin system